MSNTLPLADTYGSYILSSWGIALLILLMMLVLPVFRHAQIQKQLAKQVMRQQRFKNKKTPHDTHT